MVTGAGVGRGAFSVCFFGVAEAVGFPRGVGAWASVKCSAAIERRVRSESTFCISCYFAVITSCFQLALQEFLQ